MDKERKLIGDFEKQCGIANDRISMAKSYLTPENMVNAFDSYHEANSLYRRMITTFGEELGQEGKDLYAEVEARFMDAYRLYNEMLKDNPNVKTAEWVDKDEWDNVRCSRCGMNRGYDNDRYCSNCGSFMTNHVPLMYHHHFCQKCGAELHTFKSTSVEHEEKVPYDMTSDCEKCGFHNEVRFADAVKEIEDVGFAFDFIRTE